MLSDRALAAVLEEGRNPPSRLYPRPLYQREIQPYLARKELIVLTGVRRAGKSSLMQLLMAQMLRSGEVKEASVAYVNLEDFRLAQDLGPELLQRILDRTTVPSSRTALFLDEIQAVPGWERWARTVYDARASRVKLVVSGSNSSLLGREYGTMLTGRNFTFRVRPLSFPEVGGFGRTPRRDLTDYLSYGGFPEVVLTEDLGVKRRLLRQYFEDIVNRDVINRHELRNPRQVYTLARYLVANPGQRTSFHRLAKVFGFGSTATCLLYAHHLRESFLVDEVPFHSYSVRVRHDPSRLPKYYACDNGLIGVLEDPASPDRGQRLENAVYLALQPRGEVRYWADPHCEVDFVVENEGIQVTTSRASVDRSVKGLRTLSQADQRIRRLLLIAPKGPSAGPGIDQVEPEEFLAGP